MKCLMIIAPEGANNNSPLAEVLEMFSEQGYRIDLYSRRQGAGQAIDSRYCSGIFFTDLNDPLDSAVLFAPGLPISEETIAQAKQAFGCYSLVLGVDRGIGEAAVLAKILGIPYGLIAEAGCFDHGGEFERKRSVIMACRDLSFAVCHGSGVAHYLSDKLGIPAAKIMNLHLQHQPGAGTQPESCLQPTTEEHENLALLLDQGRHGEAEVAVLRLTSRFPGDGVSWKILGAVLTLQGRTADALEPMKIAAGLLPDDAGAQSNLGVTLNELRRLTEAESCFRRALELRPDYADALSNLGITLRELGRGEEAEACYRRALILKPDFAEALSNLGVVLQDRGDRQQAEAAYRRAVAIRPDYGDARTNLAGLLSEQGDFLQAFEMIRQSLRSSASSEAKKLFVACVRNLHFSDDDPEIRALLLRALAEPWCRPTDLSGTALALVKLNPAIGPGIARADAVWPRRLPLQQLLGERAHAALAAEPLLLALLVSAPVCGRDFERFLTMARLNLLEDAVREMPSGADSGALPDFYVNLARQCFINEYVFSGTADEFHKVQDLRNGLVTSLAAGGRMSPLRVVAVAAYFPLCTLPQANRLLEMSWPEALTALLVQQISEPAQELREDAGIPCLTVIDDAITRMVQSQYEENPYPRWIKMPPPLHETDVLAYVRRKFPEVAIDLDATGGINNILVAGCGTGQHSIGTAQRFPGAHVLAVDLSMASLRYATRKTREMGLTLIEYAQADLMKLGEVGRTFDVIESSGVLHHLADPWAGWRVLLSLLRPGGLMKLGFYSAQARRHIIRLRAFSAGKGFGATADDIRRYRQELMNVALPDGFGGVIRSQDFFSISTCRDLLFHVQERCLTLTEIDAFLQENELTFLGFEIDPHVLMAYKRRFPADAATTNLAGWQCFEDEHPDTFFGMYQFWIRKAG